MAFAVTHILFAMVLVDIFRHQLLKTHYIKRWQFSTKWLFFVGFMAILPDIDIILQYILPIYQSLTHGGFTHQLYISLFALFLAVIFYFWKVKIFVSHRTLTLICLMIAVGFLTHIALDCVFEGGYALMPPFLSNNMCIRIVAPEHQIEFMAGMDAVLFVIWLFYEEKRHKIRDVL